MFTYLIWFFVFYLLYRFVFGFIIPVYIASKKVKAQMKDMREGMNRSEGASRPTESAFASETSRSASSDSKGDYIEFEEIK